MKLFWPIVISLVLWFGIIQTISCISGQIGLINKKADTIGQENKGVITAPKQVSGNSAVAEKGDENMFGEWSLIWTLGIMISLIILVTELLGKYGPFIIIPKKTLSLFIAVLVFIGFKIFTPHSWLYLSVSAAGSWYLATLLYRDFVKFQFFYGWLKKI